MHGVQLRRTRGGAHYGLFTLRLGDRAPAGAQPGRESVTKHSPGPFLSSFFSCRMLNAGRAERRPEKALVSRCVVARAGGERRLGGMRFVGGDGRHTATRTGRRGGQVGQGEGALHQLPGTSFQGHAGEAHTTVMSTLCDRWPSVAI